MKEDVLLKLLENDELASSLKQSLMEQIARNTAMKEYKAERVQVLERADAYQEATKKKLKQLNMLINGIESEEQELMRVTDRYGNIDGPHFSRESIMMLIKFMEEYKDE